MDSVALLTHDVEAARSECSQTSSGADDRFLQKVIQSFNTWAFKREQPCRPQMMSRVVARAIEQKKPIDFVLYWGKGPRSEIADPDLQCLDFLNSLCKRVCAVHGPGVAIKLVFTDTHAKLNGHSTESIAAYFAEVEREAKGRGFACHMLGDLTAAAAPSPDAGDEVVPPESLSLLAQSAMRWYRGQGTALDGAIRYYRMNMVEKRVIAKAFPSSVFVTFNGSEQRALFPDSLPIFYMYSMKRGTAVKPWFLPATETPALTATVT